MDVFIKIVIDCGVQAVDFYKQHYTSEALVNIAWALAEATHWTPKVADIANVLESRGGLKRLSNFRLFPILRSFAQLNYSPPALFDGALPANQGG